MPTEIFTVEQFEAALPRDKETDEPLWERTDIGTEYTYALPVEVDGDNKAVILIQSSIRRGKNQCDGTGENSIRAWLVETTDFSNPLAPKVVRWTARTRNWRDNLLSQLRELWKIGLFLGPCPKCGAAMKVKTANTDKNKGRQFVACSAPREKCGKFVGWLEELIEGKTQSSAS